MKIELVSRGKSPIYVETDQEDWPHWRYEGEWQNLMGMSWEYVDPPEELRDEFDQIVKDHWQVDRVVMCSVANRRPPQGDKSSILLPTSRKEIKWIF